MSPDAWLELVKTGGALGALILVIWLLAKRKFVLGYMYEQEREEKIMWRDTALNLLKLGEQSAKVAEHAAGAAASTASHDREELARLRDQLAALVAEGRQER